MSVERKVQLEMQALHKRNVAQRKRIQRLEAKLNHAKGLLKRTSELPCTCEELGGRKCLRCTVLDEIPKDQVVQVTHAKWVNKGPARG